MYLFLKSDHQYFKIVVCRALFQYAFEDTTENNRGLPACQFCFNWRERQNMSDGSALERYKVEVKGVRL